MNKKKVTGDWKQKIWTFRWQWCDCEATVFVLSHKVCIHYTAYLAGP